MQTCKGAADRGGDNDSRFGRDSSDNKGRSASAPGRPGAAAAACEANQRTSMNKITRTAWGVMAVALLAGCEGRPSLLPNSDPDLRKTSTQFAADAAKRFPYPTAAEKAGEAQGRA